MSKKLIALIALACAALLLGLNFINVSGKQNDKIRQIDPGFAEYVSAYTSGVISNESSIRVRLASDHPASQPGKEISEDYFDFYPEIRGKAEWVDSRTIEFNPAQRLASNQVFEAKFFLSKLITNVPEKFQTMEFNVKTIPQSFEISVDGARTTDRKSLRWQTINGFLSTADGADNDLIEKVISVKQDNRRLKITWEHASSTLHKFVIDSIERSAKEGSVIIDYDGSPIQSSSRGNKKITIPGLSDFTITDVKVVNHPDQFARIQFSDPLSEAQDLSGLIRIGATQGLSFTIEDNEVRVYTSSRLTGKKLITIDAGVKNILGKTLKKQHTEEVMFEELKPSVKLVGKGVIIPNSDGILFPFEAVALNKVDVKIVRIYENNIAQFLQVNDLQGERELKRVGKVVLKKTIPLAAKSNSDYSKWNTYHLDLSELIKKEPGAIYKVIISYKKEYSVFSCEGQSTAEKEMQQVEEVMVEEEEDAASDYNYYSDYYYDSYYYDDYDYDNNDGYSKRNDPCEDAYYGSRRDISRNVLASDLGLMAKRGTDGSLLLVVTDLKTSAPVPNVSLEVYDFSQQKLITLISNEQGIATAVLKKKSFLLIAKKGDQRGYLKLDDGSSLSLSAFEVSGEVVQKGLKGLIYGERGVWRPGDTLFLSFVLEDETGKLPPTHPVTMELINPRGQVTKKLVKSASLNGFYNFTTNTETQDPTGNWMARIKVGGAVFTKNLKIETVMPNRLKINLAFGKQSPATLEKNESVDLDVKWLHGATARNLKSKVEITLSQMTTVFKGFDGFTFDDPASRYYSETNMVFDGRINEEGHASFTPEIRTENAPGMLRANFVTRVFEDGGAFSIDRYSIPYSPYESYVGIKTPPVNPHTRMLTTDTTHKIRIVTVNAQGKPVNRKVNIRVYKVKWRWWWNSSENNDLASYIGSSYNEAYSSTDIETVNGKAEFNLRVNNPEWGRFLVRVTDETSGHSAGEVIYMDWPAWAGSALKGQEGATMLTFAADKKTYNVGEMMKVTIPSGDEGRALISVETGSKVLQTYWADAKKPHIIQDIPVTAEMAPNIYVNVTLIQPHAQTKNDLPIRLYGIIPIQVEDKNTHLRPVIKTAVSWQPETTASVNISEENGKAMTYTLAIVDEGLLDLTRFETPDPWNHFFAKEALGVKSFDMFDMVLGAYGAQLERILSVGGDEDIGAKGGAKANRFKPMVRFAGPFHLEKGVSKTHNIAIPQYVGSARVMVVAGYKGAYGNAEKAVPVKKPLMVLATLPRVVGPGETVDLPVTVFAMDQKVKNVTVQIEPNNLFTVEDNAMKNLTFNQTGDEVVTFRMKVNSAIGIGKVKVTAFSGNERATHDIELDVRNPNPPVTEVTEATVEAGETWSGDYKLVGVAGTNSGTIEVSTVPPLNLDRRLRYLIQYPHGCIEQTTSGAFPQLFLTDLMDLDQQTKNRVTANISSAINRLRLFQTTSGGFGYWPGDNQADEWGSNYAGHFLLEAENKGYSIPSGFIDNWKKYQKQAAINFVPKNNNYNYYHDDLIQAYRLYTLALAGSPELGAMNRLKEDKNLSLSARWRLAAAYQMAGQSETAKNLTSTLSMSIEPYRELSYTYGSDDRDEAMILETLTLMGQTAKGAFIVKELSQKLAGGGYWMSTQTTAYSLLAVSRYYSKTSTSSELNAVVKINGNATNINSKKVTSSQEIKITGNTGGKLEVKNNGKGTMFIRVTMNGVPPTGDPTEKHSNMFMEVTYHTMQGDKLDVSQLEQGTDFFAEVTVSNPNALRDYREMALTQIFPSGWEIRNPRMDGTEVNKKSNVPEYQDIRDDRVYTYFDVIHKKPLTFRILLNATYLGKFYLPTVYCEAMYDNSISSRVPGKWVNVVTPGKVQ